MCERSMTITGVYWKPNSCETPSPCLAIPGMASSCSAAFIVGSYAAENRNSGSYWCHGQKTPLLTSWKSVYTICSRKSSRYRLGGVHASISVVTVTDHPTHAPHKQGTPQHSPGDFREQLVQRCMKASTLLEAKAAHECLLSAELIPDIFVENTLINTYIRCGSIADAAQVFENMNERNVFSWTLILAGYERYGKPEEALKLFWQMEQQKVTADDVMFVTIIKVCTRAASIEQGKEIHGFTVKCGLPSNTFVFNALVDMYAKCGSMLDAMHVFERIDEKTVISWNSIISGCVQMGQHTQALSLYQQMKCSGSEPDEVTLVCVLKSCGSLQIVEEGILLHVYILRFGYETNRYIGSTLVDFYSKSGRLDIASRVFSAMHEPDVVTWNALIAGYASHGQGVNSFTAFRCFLQGGVSPNEITLMNVLNAFAGPAFLDDGQFVHAQAIEAGLESDVSVGNSLIDMYGKCQSIEDGVVAFNKLPLRDTVSWNTLMAAYIEAGSCEEAVNLFKTMQEEQVEPNEASFVSGLHVCARSTALATGMSIHAQAVCAGQESGTHVGNTLIDLYSKCGHLEDSLHLFNTLQDRDVVSWNGMMTGYLQHRDFSTVLKLLQGMQLDGLKPNEISYINCLSACANMESLEHGRVAHSDVVKAGFDTDIMVETTIVDMYVKCVSIHEARDVFDKMPEKVTAAWNTMIAGYGDNELEEEALRLFYVMQTEEVMVDDFTFVSILNACASICALDEGKCIYSQYVKAGCDVNIFVGSALVDMYAKCGHVEDARYVFDEMPDLDLFLWTVMIAGYAQHGHHQEVFELWEKMQERGVKPDGTIFISVLSACSHIGLLDKGLQLFSSMIIEHGISPTKDHFACFIDLLGRAGCLNEAEHFINKLPLQPDAAVWRTLLGACKSHGNLEIAKLASKRLLKLEPEDHTAYVFLSNTYATSEG